jgi:hypothetical protein
MSAERKAAEPSLKAAKKSAKGTTQKDSDNAPTKEVSHAALTTESDTAEKEEPHIDAIMLSEDCIDLNDSAYDLIGSRV